MADEYVHKNPRDPTEERFERLKSHVIDINHNMNLLMVALPSKLGIFGDDGGSNSDIISEGKSGDQEDLGKESQKEPKKE